MIFATIDFIQYLLKIGKYSQKSIDESGGVIASDKLIDVNTLEIGDMVFFHPRISLFSWLIMYWTNGNWSHVGMISGNGKICHAISEGVVEEDINKYFDNKSYLSIIHRTLSNQEKEELLSFIQSTVGSKYAWGKALWLGILILNNQVSGYRFRLTIDFVLIPCLLVIYYSPSSYVIYSFICITIMHIVLIIKGYKKE